MGATENLKQQTGIAKKPATVQQLLEALKPQIAMALPRHLQPERMVRIALTCIRQNPKLADCEPQSLLASVMLASQLGLEPGVLGQCYLIPYKRVCTLVPGWMGLLDLMNRAGKASAWTGAVYEGDEFEWALGDQPYLVHRPCGEDDISRLKFTYGIARTSGSQFAVIEVWPVGKIWRHRDKMNRVGESHYSYKFPEAYARKIPLLQVLKYVPRSVELATAMSIDAQAEGGYQKYEISDVKNVIEGVIEEHQATEIPSDQLMSSCSKHGEYPGEGNCPQCEEEGRGN